ncbi:MAG: peroxiredoxin [Gammaproteobacteria bacterium]|nr:peroxiredoxin [Gammaproteobacteria bacterium]MYE29907.1 peroxiredoxin [Gammaproteobacteria bacterium]
MTIAAGDRIPAVTFRVLTGEGPKPLGSDEVFGGKKVVMFIVPGAFTPGCSLAHLPGYVVNADAIKAKGVDTIACMSVNDAFVMGAWGESQNAGELLMLADGNGEFATAAGLEADFSGYGMGGRAKRCAMIVDDGTVTHIAVEPGGEIDVSSAESILAHL